MAAHGYIVSATVPSNGKQQEVRILVKHISTRWRKQTTASFIFGWQASPTFLSNSALAERYKFMCCSLLCWKTFSIQSFWVMSELIRINLTFFSLTDSVSLFALLDKVIIVKTEQKRKHLINTRNLMKL